MKIDHSKIKKHLKRQGRIPIAGTSEMEAVKNVLPDKRGISRSILWILKEAEEKISPKQMASYLGVDIKTVYKQMNRFASNPVAGLLFTKKKENGKVFYYSHLPKTTDLESFYYVIVTINKIIQGGK